MASREKVDIRRSEQFQEMDEALTRAMAELDSTIDRVSALFQADGPDGAPEAGETPPDAHAAPEAEVGREPGAPESKEAEGFDEAEGEDPE